MLVVVPLRFFRARFLLFLGRFCLGCQGCSLPAQDIHTHTQTGSTLKIYLSHSRLPGVSGALVAAGTPFSSSSEVEHKDQMTGSEWTFLGVDGDPVVIFTDFAAGLLWRSEGSVQFTGSVMIFGNILEALELLVSLILFMNARVTPRNSFKSWYANLFHL